jgi:hypothetical protein
MKYETQAIEILDNNLPPNIMDVWISLCQTDMEPNCGTLVYSDVAIENPLSIPFLSSGLTLHCPPRAQARCLAGCHRCRSQEARERMEHG